MGSPRGMRPWLIAIVLAACGPGNVPADYPPAELQALGIHESPVYVARDLMPALGAQLVVAHPRLGQAAIRMPGERIEVEWIAPGLASQPASVSIEGGGPVAFGPGGCDDDGVCHLDVAAPALAPGLYGLCIEVAGVKSCSPGALAIVDHYNDPATIVQISDSHVGDPGAEELFARVVDRINELRPDLVVFTGDGTNNGFPEQRTAFVAQLARLRVPSFVVTGNHDYEHAGIDDHLLAVGPELDLEARYGALRLIGLSTGQDLDDGDHDTTISESAGPDPSQLAWLAGELATPAPTIVLLHHPIYNGLFATVGPDARDQLRDLVTRDGVLAVLAGHTHVTSAFDADGNSRGLSRDGETDVDRARWPLHHVAARATNGSGGFALLHLGPAHVDYQWIGL